MATVRTEGGAAIGNYEPALTLTVLPRCPGCGLPHPRARKLDTDECPDCGTSCPQGQTRTVFAALTGWTPWALLARLSLWIGRVLNNLARSL